MEGLTRTLPKLLYGSLFVVILPLLLVAWASGTSQVVRLPQIHSRLWGFLTAAAGLLLVGWGMISLWRTGGGLPMNAFPPPRYVSRGIYSLFWHPIYVGFVCACAGFAIAFDSASGLWLIAPTMALASAALVLGYELPDMRNRFADLTTQRLLPPGDETAPSVRDRCRCYLTVLFPWFLIYEAFVKLGVPADARVAYLPFELRLPIVPWTAVLYISVYVFVLLVPMAAPTRRDLRRFSLSGMLSMILVFPIYLAVPLIAPPRPFPSTGILGRILSFDRVHDTAAAAFPSYHVVWAFIAAAAIGATPRQRRLGWSWALLASASCVTTGMHALADVLSGLLVAWIVFKSPELWLSILSSCERIANSWHEWRLGPLRIINHGAYAAACVFAGILIIDTLLGPGRSIVSLSIFAGGVIGSALWAQYIEGSPSLLRPLGFYGGMIGTAAAGGFASYLSRTSIWITLAALVVAAPWIQGIGRFRCLVQGCCHGRPAPPNLGIRYSHPQSRVLRVASLGGIPLFPTPLYSFAWNLFIAVIVTRIYTLHTTTSMVGGIYLILSGLGRFAEEAYRGEPQTPAWSGLRLYQWMAILSVMVGAMITTITSAPLTTRPGPHASSIVVATVCAMLAWCVTGVDFPDSTARFARLT